MDGYYKKKICFCISFIVILSIEQLSSETIPSLDKNQRCKRITSFYTIHKGLGSGTALSNFPLSLEKIKTLQQGKLLLKQLILEISFIRSGINIDEVYKKSVDIVKCSNIPKKTKKQLKTVFNYLALEIDNSNIDSVFYEENIPADLIIAGIEIFSGTLLQLVPGCTWLGRLLIADAIRRGANGLQEMDSNRNSYSFN